MASNVDICNLALTYLSTSRIESLTEDTENARKCNAIFELRRDKLIEENNWNFARAEATLAEVSQTVIATDYWSKIHQVPSDCLRVIRIIGGDYDFAIYGNHLYSNVSSPSIEYVKRVTDSAQFSNAFVNALAADLAAILAYGITQNATMADVAAKRAEKALIDAKVTDSQEGYGIGIKSGSLLGER